MQMFYGVSHLCVLVSVELAKGEQQEQDGPQLIRKAERETAGCLPHFLSCSLLGRKKTKKKPTRHLHPPTWLQWLCRFHLWTSASFLFFFPSAFAHILPELDKVLGIMATMGLISELCLQASVSGSSCIHKLHLPSSLEKATHMGEWIAQSRVDLFRKRNTGRQWEKRLAAFRYRKLINDRVIAWWLAMQS